MIPPASGREASAQQRAMAFKVIPLPPEKFKAMIGIDELPEGWADWLRGEAR